MHLTLHEHDDDDDDDDDDIVENFKTRISCSVTFSAENRAVYEIMWKNIAERGGLQMRV